MKHICSYYIWFVIFFGAAPLFILYLVRLIFWCSTSVHTIFGSSYFWVQHMCSYYIWFVIFWNVLHLRVLLLDLRVLALFVLLWRVILWYVILLRVLLLHWRVIPVVHGTHGASYISVLNLGMPTSMVLFKWDGSFSTVNECVLLPRKESDQATPHLHARVPTAIPILIFGQSTRRGQPFNKQISP